MRRWVLVLLLGAIWVVAGPARAEPQAATFALIIGVNRGADRELPPLRYADDDAARYQELFRLLGAKTHLLARLDANTRRLHAQAAAEASVPRRSELERLLNALAGEIREAKRRGVRTALYVVYAGHGNVKDGEAYVLLEDDRLNARRLTEIVQRPGADRAHLIVDACNSGLLAASRGPGGRRRPFSGFSDGGALVDNPQIGLLLSTSSGRESHEWEAFQAGVFSHEVRSGLSGAADADKDGSVSYREIAAFVANANAAIPNERFRPDVYARPPSGSDVLVNVRRALDRRVEVSSTEGGHWVLENSWGVRLADFHPGPGFEMRITRPLNEALFLRRLAPITSGRFASEDSIEEEYALPAGGDVVTLAELSSSPLRVASRGAAHESFSLIFSLPFSQQTVDAYRPPSVEPSDQAVYRRRASARLPEWRRSAAITSFGLGAAAIATGGALWISAETIRSDGDSGASQREIVDRNQRIADRRLGAYVSFGAAALATGAGVALLVWPAGSGTEVSAGVWPGGVSITIRDVASSGRGSNNVR